MDSELFFEWFKRVFLKYAVPQRPVFLLVDGHKSHITLDLVDLARDNDVVLFCSPPPHHACPSTPGCISV